MLTARTARCTAASDHDRRTAARRRTCAARTDALRPRSGHISAPNHIAEVLEARRNRRKRGIFGIARSTPARCQRVAPSSHRLHRACQCTWEIGSGPGERVAKGVERVRAQRQRKWFEQRSSSALAHAPRKATTAAPRSRTAAPSAPRSAGAHRQVRYVGADAPQLVPGASVQRNGRCCTSKVQDGCMRTRARVMPRGGAEQRHALARSGSMLHHQSGTSITSATCDARKIHSASQSAGLAQIFSGSALRPWSRPKAAQARLVGSGTFGTVPGIAACVYKHDESIGL